MIEPLKKDTLSTMIAYYKKSPKFCKLRPKTQKDYIDQLNKVCSTLVQNDVKLGNMKLSSLSLKHMTASYESWLKTGVRTANVRISALSVVLKYAIQKEILNKNPISGLTRQKDSARSVRWEKEDVKKFVETAYSDIKYRSIGLICHMAYDFGQRIGDLRELQWDDIDFKEKRLDIKQSKMGAEVHLPISDNLIRMLRRQKEDFGFQPYVCPRPQPIRGQSFTPYRMQEVCYLVKEVIKKADLCTDLWAMDLRRTAITEMVEAGVDMAGVMQVSGHQNPQSVKPYLVNTFSGASQALAKRNENKV
tara:strand:+ start:927 stop:1841 length:915 start_codon:yes stop_codon:yes gene_type:complete